MSRNKIHIQKFVCKYITNPLQNIHKNGDTLFANQAPIQISSYSKHLTGNKVKIGFIYTEQVKLHVKYLIF
jgi:hypothetical protein